MGRLLRLACQLAAVLLALSLPSAAAASSPVRVLIRNVNFRLDPSLVLHIETLRGRLLPTRPESLPSFDDPDSFYIVVDSATVSLDAISLQRLMNGYVFADPASGFQHIRVTFDHGELKQSGSIKKGVSLPAALIGDPAAAADGEVLIHPRHMQLLHLPVLGLLHVTGLSLADFVHTDKTRGLSIQHGDLELDPATALPAPHIRARVISTRVAGARLWIRLAAPASPEPTDNRKESRPGDDPSPSVAADGGDAPLAPRGFMRFQGGRLLFGKTEMRPADLTIENAARQGPFDFFLRDYQRQLVAGTVQATSQKGWIATLPSYFKLKTSAR